MKGSRGLLAAICIVYLSILLLSTGGCTGNYGNNIPLPAGEPTVENLTAGKQKIKVVTTIFPLCDIIRQVGGEGVEVLGLLAAGESPHTYEPAVEQARAIAEADLVVCIGAGLDSWAIKQARQEQARLVEIIDEFTDFLPAPKPFHGSGDPHIWLDPLLVKEGITPLIADALHSINPQQEKLFQHNLAQFQDKLQELHERIAARAVTFQQKRFISYHSAWQYFARRYGLEEVAAVEEFPGKEPSAQWMAELVDLAAQHQITMLFAEPQLGSDTAKVIAQEIGGEVLLLDPLGGEGLTGRDSYINLLSYNIDIMAKALQ